MMDVEAFQILSWQVNQVQDLDGREGRKAPAGLVLQCWMEMKCNGREQTGGQL